MTTCRCNVKVTSRPGGNCYTLPERHRPGCCFEPAHDPDRAPDSAAVPTGRRGRRAEPRGRAGDRESGQLVGAIGLGIDRRFKLAELGYWIGKPFWNRGYATEAAVAIIRYGFTSLELNRIASRHFTRNPASGRVMQKAGMQHEGTARQSMIKWGKYEDLQLYAILREDWSGA